MANDDPRFDYGPGEDTSIGYWGPSYPPNDFLYGPGESTDIYAQGMSPFQMAPPLPTRYEQTLPGPGMTPEQLGQPNQPTPGGAGKPILQLLALLLAGGGAAGVGQNLFGRPPTATTTPRLSPEQLALLAASQGQFGQSQNILNLLIGGLQNPQIPPALSALTEQAFRPAMGDIASQAIESARRRGFAGGAELLNTGPGGAIAGPALSNLQGQMAQAKLNLYQNNIANLIQTLQGSGQLGFGQGRLAAGLPAGQVQQAPRPSILDTLSQGVGVARGVGDILGAAGSAGGQGIGSWLSGLNPF